MSRQILKKFPNTAASVGHCFPFFSLKTLGGRLIRFYLQLPLLFQFPVTRNHCGDFKEGVAPQENMLFSTYVSRFYRRKKSYFRFDIELQRQLKIIRLSQL